MLCARALVMLGDLDELAHCEAWAREAAECEDLTALTRLRLIALPRVLAENDLVQAERTLELPPELRASKTDLTAALLLNGKISVALYSQDVPTLLDLTEEVDDFGLSPLVRVRLWNSDYMLMRARLLLAASRFASDPAPLLAKAEQSIEALEKLGMECHTDHARVLRAGLAQARGSEHEALELLDAILADPADMGGESGIIRACARMNKGRLVGGDAGAALVQTGERDLSSRGVKSPAQFARIYAPGVD
jgi:hypothetical protein